MSLYPYHYLLSSILLASTTKLSWALEPNPSRSLQPSTSRISLSLFLSPCHACRHPLLSLVNQSISIQKHTHALFSPIKNKIKQTQLPLILPPIQCATLPFTPNFLKASFKHVLQSMIEHVQSCGPLPIGEGWSLY